MGNGLIKRTGISHGQETEISVAFLKAIFNINKKKCFPLCDVWARTTVELLAVAGSLQVARVTVRII